MSIPFWPKSSVATSPLGKISKCKPDKARPAHVLPPVLAVVTPASPPVLPKAKPAAGGKPQAELDIECYSNYFLVKFRRPDGAYIDFEMDDNFQDACLDRAGIRRILARYEIVTFNGTRFDIPLLKYALQYDGCTTADLKACADDLIKNELAVYRFDEKHGLRDLDVDHIDLSPLTPMMTGLKLCGARLHSPRLQDLPYADDTVLTADQMDAVCEYCGNDLEVTAALKAEYAEDIALRRDLGARYGVDLRSRGDAQCAEDIFRVEAKRRSGKRTVKPRESHAKEFYYKIPDFIKFIDPQLNAVLDVLRAEKFTAKPVNKGIAGPEKLAKAKINLGGMTYVMGIGGLHSTEKSAFHLADNEFDLWDFDVTSYYPAIILNSGLYPPSIGRVFLDIYKDIVDERIAAKKAGDKIKADGMKTTANGVFGKLGSPWSTLYAPELMIQVTLTGQLSILMLIDRLTHHGLQVVSGNTDGVVVKPRRDQEDLMRTIIARWSRQTGFDVESTHYAGLWSRDINNYLAISHNGQVKAKGTFGYAGRKKNPEYDVCTDALIAYFKHGVPVEDTVQACADIRKFISVRQVNGGAVKDGEYLGRVVRWYYAVGETGFIAYKTNGNKVPQSDGARPVMTLPAELPADINYDWYVKKCSDLFY